MAEYVWSNVGIDIQTALATAIVITGITKANPAVVSYTGTDPANGDAIVLAVSGMHQLDKRVFRVANVNSASNTLELEDEDSTAYDTFSAGTAQVITFGASMSTVTAVNASGGDPEYTDVTTVHQKVRRRVPTVVSPMQITFESLFAPGDAALAELRKATNSVTTRAVRVRFGEGASVPRMLFVAYPSAAGVPTGNAQEAVKTTVTFEAQGLPTIYAD